MEIIVVPAVTAGRLRLRIEECRVVNPHAVVVDQALVFREWAVCCIAYGATVPQGIREDRSNRWTLVLCIARAAMTSPRATGHSTQTAAARRAEPAGRVWSAASLTDDRREG